jgi:hypothetical protein
MGKLSDLMMGGVLAAKYSDPCNPVVDLQINDTLNSNTLIDLGFSINVIMHETMQSLRLTCLRETPTILQLADRSTIKPEGILEDVVIYIDSWEYPTKFMVLYLKASLGGYPLILGRPWLATADAYIGCRSRNMTISHMTSTKQLTLYPPIKSNIDLETPL